MLALLLANRCPARPVLIVALIAVAGLAPAAFSAPQVGSTSSDDGVLAELQKLPLPNLEPEEPEVRGQLEQARSLLEQRLEAVRGSAGGALDAESVALLAESFADLGRLYYLYLMLDLSDIAFSNALVLVPEALDWSYIRAVVRSANGSQQKALEDLQAIVAAEPRNVPARVRTGDLLYDLARYDEALVHYEAAVAINPKEAAAWAGRGQVASREGEYAKAVEFLGRALELQPAADALNYPLAQSLRHLGETDAARAALKRHSQGAVKINDPLLDGLGNANRSSQALLHAGNAAMRRGEMSQAAEYFRRYLLRRPDHAIATHNLGLVLMASQQREEGLALLRKAVELDPNFRGGHYFLASALAEDGQFEEALGHYQRAHEIDPLERTIHADYAALLARIGRIDEALAELEPIVREDPDAQYVRLKYATILAISGRGAEALPLLERISEVGIENSFRAEALYHLGLLRLEQEQFEPARNLLEKSVQLGPGSGPSNAALAQLLGRAGDLDGAALHFARALKAQPLDDSSHFGLAMALLLSDRDVEARESLESAVRLLPAHGALRHLLARVLAASSDSAARDGERAILLAQELVDREPSLDHAETLAMAFAEAGRFEDAVRWQRRVMSQSRPEDDPSRGLRQARLELFQQGQPVRDPWESR